MLLLVQSYALNEAPYKLSVADAKLACINLLKFGSFSYWFDKPWFHTEGRLAVVLITPSLGVSNWTVIYKNSYINTAPPCTHIGIVVRSVFYGMASPLTTKHSQVDPCSSLRHEVLLTPREESNSEPLWFDWCKFDSHAHSQDLHKVCF
jgi:hypothetical protein